MKIVSLSSYPVSTPQHGGQRRADAIIQRAAVQGVQITNLPIFFAASYPGASAEEMQTALDDMHRAGLAQAGLREDLHICHGLTPDHPAVAAALARIRALAPDALQFEQPWLYPLFAPLLAKGGALGDLAVIYSSQNIESHLLPTAFHAEATDLEQRLTRRADLAVAVCAADAAVLESWRSPGQRPVVLAPNGSWPPPALPSDSPRPIPQDYVLFVGSAHPPNAEGYWQTMGVVPGCIPPTGRFVIAGGVNNLLGADARFQKFRRLNAALVQNLGMVSEAELSLLLHHARAICLPITGGGGTNLKTAEALLSLKPVVAMRAAFRGFEGFADLPGVYLAEDAPGFRRLIRDVFTGRLGSTRKASDVASLEWTSALAPLQQAYQALRQNRGAAA